jgi:hypothetical protein
MTGSKRKSADYYEKNKEAITEIRSYYDQLYSQQAFSVGFTDKSFKYYVMEVTTDTLRYIFNTDQSETKLFETILRFNYDTLLLQKLAFKMKEIKCLWLDKSSFYLEEKKETVTFLSFKSAKVDKPFVENKYYVLVFLNQKLEHPDLKAKVKKGDIVKINDLVYFAIGNRFR